MDPTILFVLVAVAIAVGAILSWRATQRRREEWFAAAQRLGLEYSRHDPFRLDALPFNLFRKGDGRGCENVLHGTWHKMELRVFDYWYYTQSTDSKGRRSKSYTRFCCALASIPADCPHLEIVRETVLSRIGDRLGMADIQFESDEFNRAYQIRSQDRRFAHYLVDARMMEWLLRAPKGHGYETLGPWLLVHCGRIPVSRIDGLLQHTRGFSERIPRVVRDVYRAAGT